ncbi:hypothetical protein N8H74_19650 [Pseudomonas sp. B2M1-30]|uniref:hypothetical protein n=1 Tax=Pseudomonas TaxID=286 RepID=UPI0021CA6C89|nr:MULTISPECIES: hypothetical protein [Pseudomonas]MCU0120484.1 hypothetical protein [Pseudomonas sp. B2M1-30]MCU7262502.1 hypothetical protein [Pseudomonas koreensis]
MKCLILTAITLAVLSITTVQAQQAIPVSPTPQPGSPGTATPTPYPQISPVPIPRTGPGSGGPPLVPIDLPTPPAKDQPLPGLEQNDTRSKSPGG